MAYQWLGQADDRLQPVNPAAPQSPYTNPESQVYNPYLENGSTGNPFTDPNSQETQNAQAQAASEAAAAQAAAEAQAAQVAQAQGNVAATGVQLGSLNTPGLWTDRSDLRMDQSNAERYADQRSNYYYGGYEGAADEAVAAARGAVDPYASSLAGISDTYMQQGADAQGRTAPIDQGNLALHGQGVGGVYDTAGALTQYAQQGPGPSVAQANLAANTGAAMRQQLAFAGSGRGAGGGASAYRQAAANQAQIQGQGNAQAAMLGAQEAQDWRQAQLGAYQAAGGLYGAGASNALAGAQYTTGAQQQQTGLNDQYSLGAGGLAIEGAQGGGQLALGGEQLANQIQGTALSGSQAYENNLTDIYGISQGIGKAPNEDMSTMDWVQLGADALGTVGSYFGLSNDDDKTSDIRAKKNIKPDSALDAISDAGSYSYNYIDPERHGQGTYVGPMAQELEGAPGVVHEGPDGKKAIDPGRLALANTSAIAELNRKVEAKAPTQQTAYSGDPARLEFEAQKYGTPVYGAAAPGGETSESGGSMLDMIFGPSVGQQAADVTAEEYRNQALRQLFLNPPREDQYL